jgi:hypothetical protein
MHERWVALAVVVLAIGCGDTGLDVPEVPVDLARHQDLAVPPDFATPHDLSQPLPPVDAFTSTRSRCRARSARACPRCCGKIPPA